MSEKTGISVADKREVEKKQKMKRHCSNVCF